MKKIKNALIAILVIATITGALPSLIFAADDNDPYRGCSVSPIVLKK